MSGQIIEANAVLTLEDNFTNTMTTFKVSMSNLSQELEGQNKNTARALREHSQNMINQVTMPVVGLATNVGQTILAMQETENHLRSRLAATNELTPDNEQALQRLSTMSAELDRISSLGRIEIGLVSTGLYDMNLDLAQIMDLLPIAVDVADATGQDLWQVAQRLADIPITALGDFTDAVHLTASRTGVDLLTLMDSFDNAGANAQNLTLNTQQMLAALGTIAHADALDTQTGTHIFSGLVNLMTKSDWAQETIDPNDFIALEPIDTDDSVQQINEQLGISIGQLSRQSQRYADAFNQWINDSPTGNNIARTHLAAFRDQLITDISAQTDADANAINKVVDAHILTIATKFDLGGLLEAFHDESMPADALSELVGLQAAQPFATLLENYDTFKGLEQTINNNATGAIQRSLSVIRSGPQASLNQAQASITDAALSLGEAGFSDMMEGMADGLTSVIDTLSDMNPELLKMALYTVAAAAGIGPLMLGISGMASAAQLGVKGARLYGEGISHVSDILRKHFLATTAVSTMQDTLGTSAQRAAGRSAIVGNVLMAMTSPIGLTIAAVGGLVGAFYLLSKRKREDVTATEDQINSMNALAQTARDTELAMKRNEVTSYNEQLIDNRHTLKKDLGNIGEVYEYDQRYAAYTYGNYKYGQNENGYYTQDFVEDLVVRTNLDSVTGRPQLGAGMFSDNAEVQEILAKVTSFKEDLHAAILAEHEGDIGSTKNFIQNNGNQLNVIREELSGYIEKGLENNTLSKREISHLERGYATIQNFTVELGQISDTIRIVTDLEEARDNSERELDRLEAQQALDPNTTPDLNTAPPQPDNPNVVNTPHNFVDPEVAKIMETLNLNVEEQQDLYKQSLTNAGIDIDNLASIDNEEQMDLDEIAEKAWAKVEAHQTSTDPSVAALEQIATQSQQNETAVQQMAADNVDQLRTITNQANDVVAQSQAMAASISEQLANGGSTTHIELHSPPGVVGNVTQSGESPPPVEIVDK